MTDVKPGMRAWIDEMQPQWSVWNRTIWDYAETAWREYQSCAFYVRLLRNEGFEVEEGSGGMPTAFCATWSNGKGPTIGSYAEYDAVPGNCQAADVVKRPRDGLNAQAGGHTDPHSALGMGPLVGFLAAKRAMDQHGIKGRLKLMGEPAEKVRGSKPIHAAKGYYDDMDAAISFHPMYSLPFTNTVKWDTHCGAAYAPIYTFTCDEPETWLNVSGGSLIPGYHSGARVPGANDAVVQMYQFGKTLKEHVLSSGMSWSLNEAILTMGQATADNLPAGMAQIMYMSRVPTIEMAERIVKALDHFAECAAKLAHCNWKREWVCKSRPGLANHALARLTYANLEQVGPPKWEGEAIRLAQQIQNNLGLQPMARPYLEDIEQLVEPELAERELRKTLPPNQTHYTSDDYTDYCWQTPTVRLNIGRPTLKSPGGGYRYPDWAPNAMGGLNACIDPTVACASKVIAGTVIDLLGDPRHLAEAKAEFVERTGGGIGGSKWMAPLCDYPPPIHYRWPEYVTTVRGREWVIPT